MEELSNRLKEFLSKVGNDKIGNYTEFEIRFGKFVYDKNLKKSNFESNVEIDFFYRLKNFLDINVQKNKKETFTKETSHKNNVGRGNIRRILTTDKNYKNPTKEEIILKNAYNKFNIYDYDIRFSLASEKKLNKDSVNGVDWKDYDFVRFKHRVTYTTNIGKIDLTIVKEGTTEQEALDSLFKYEVEFEINKNALTDVLDLLLVLIKIKQNNFFVISNQEKKEIFKKYNALTNVSYFVGAQPETLQKDQLSLLYKELYSVTDKADGERYFMFIDDLGKIIFIDNNINGMMKTDIKTDDFKNCLIDGELIRNFGKDGELESINFYAFDLLFFDNFDIREDTRYLFKQRFDKLKSIISSCTKTNITVQVKKFIYRNVFMGSEIIMKDVLNKKYENDGLIFTPMNEPYPKNKKWSKLLKWKPADQNTIDFYAVKVSDENWELYVQGPNESRGYQGYNQAPTKVLFDVSKLCPDIPDQNEITFKTNIENGLIDPTTKMSYQTNTVIEFKWEGGKFVPLRTRWDKTSNPKKHGNFSHVACNIWNNIHNPISQDTLFHQMTNNTSPNVQSSQNPFFFERMNNFHNKVHKYLINKYTTNTSILEISPGTNDLSYYEDFKGSLHSFEFCESSNSKNNIRESCKNVKNFAKLIQSYDFMEIEFDKILQVDCKKIKQSYDNVFSSDISTFFESDDKSKRLIEFLNHKMSKTGNFIVSFIDSNLFSSRGVQDTYYTDNEIMYNLTHREGKTLLFMNSLTYENEPLPIYKKLNKEHLISLMTQNGFDCVETEDFVNMYKDELFKMEQYEKDISHTMTYCVFSKSKNNSGQTTYLFDSHQILKTKIFDTQEKLPIVLDLGSPKNILQNKLISLYKINSIADITDILNCTQFNQIYAKGSKDSAFDYSVIINYLINLQNPIKVANLESLVENTYTKDTLVLYKYKCEPQEASEKDVETQENTEVVFIVLYKMQIFYDIDQLRNDIISKKEIGEGKDIKEKKEINLEKEIGEEEEKKEEKKNINLKKEIKEALSGKITIVTLKEYLKRLCLKTSGSKQELIERLRETCIV
jgi:hypothetical protein